MCSIKNNVIEWELQHKHVENLYKHLYDNVENGGEFKLNTITKKYKEF